MRQLSVASTFPKKSDICWNKHICTSAWEYSQCVCVFSIDSLAGSVLLFSRKPCCHNPLVHVQCSKIIDYISCQETPLPPCGCYYLCLSQTWSNVFSFFSEMGPQRSEQTLQAQHLGECFNSFCLHHSCGQRFYHSVWSSAAHAGFLKPLPHHLNAFWSGPLLFICENGQK